MDKDRALIWLNCLKETKELLEGAGVCLLPTGRNPLQFTGIYGAGLLADTTMDYPLTGDVYNLMDKVQPKTFCHSFDEQLEIAERLYGNHLKFHFGKRDIDAILRSAHGYDPAVVERVRDIIYQQMRKYKYLF